jgi:hypothetical protein
MEFGADLRERPDPPDIEAEAESKDPSFAPRVGVEDGVDLLFEEQLAGGVDGRELTLVLDEVAERGIALLAHRQVERDRLPRDPKDLAEPLGCDPQAGLARQTASSPIRREMIHSGRRHQFKCGGVPEPLDRQVAWRRRHRLTLED